MDLARELRSAGFSIWLDVLDISTGARWDDEVEKALATCGIFMVILTPTSVASDNVKDEIGYAIDHGKRIVPVLLESSTIPLRLRRFQYVDFTSKSYGEGVESARRILSSLGVERNLDAGPVSERGVGKTEQWKDKSTAGSRRKRFSSKQVFVLILGGLAGVLLVVWGIMNFLGLGSLTFSSNSGPVMEEVQIPPNTEPPLINPIVEPDVTLLSIELDQDPFRGTDCNPVRQEMSAFGAEQWREGDQLFGAGLNCGMEFGIDVEQNGLYHLFLHATYAPDFGTLRLNLVRGSISGDILSIDLYDPLVKPTGPIDLGSWQLTTGENNRLTIVVEGKNPASTDYKFGLDYMTLELIP